MSCIWVLVFLVWVWLGLPLNLTQSALVAALLNCTKVFSCKKKIILNSFDIFIFQIINVFIEHVVLFHFK